MRLRLFSLVYGKQYLEWFRRACVLSLGWSRNREALRSAFVWDIYTIAADVAALDKIIEPLGITPHFHVLENIGNSGAVLQRALTRQLEQCVADKSAFLICPPDSLFGDGSIENLIAMASAGDDLVIAVPHVRVNEPGFLAALGETRRNAGLVRLAFRHLHHTWRQAEVTLRPSNSWWSGTSWRRLGDGLYAIQHRIPTAYLARPVAADVIYFKQETDLGAWDHRWPEILVEAGRQRVVGSSDGAFVIELTPPAVNNPPLKRHDGAVDDYRGQLRHHAVNRNMLAIWREGE